MYRGWCIAVYRGMKMFTNIVISEQKGSSVTYQDTVMIKDPSDVPPENEDFMQRLWAYLTVKQLLERQVLLKGQEKEDEEKEALKLSLKYQFVTPLTSMVVTKPQEDEVEVADKPKEGKEDPRPPAPRLHYHLGHRQPSRPRLSRKRARISGPVLLSQNVLSAAHPGFSDETPTITQRSQKPVLSTMSVPIVRSNRFLLSAAGQSKPLCFDVPLPHKLKLLQDSASEFSMNGESMTRQNGFIKIVFHYKTNHRLTINTRSIRYHDGQNDVEFLWGQEPTQHSTEGVSLILRSNEMDVTMGNIRVVILLHKKNGDVFLWPAVRQQPKDVSLMGILGKAEASYEEIQGSQTPTLKIMDQEVKASWEDVTDYTLPSTPVIRCLLVPFQAVMQGDISDFTVTQL